MDCDRCRHRFVCKVKAHSLRCVLIVLLLARMLRASEITPNPASDHGEQWARHIRYTRGAPVVQLDIFEARLVWDLHGWGHVLLHALLIA